MRVATVARLAVGAMCLAAPGVALRAVGAPDRADRRVQAAARVLGLRLVGQAGLEVARGRHSRGLDVAVELSHAASMLPVIALWPVHRRAASVSAVVATGLALLDLLESPG